MTGIQAKGSFPGDPGKGPGDIVAWKGNAPPVVLVAEDDTLVRLALVDALGEGGFSVIESDGADGAVEVMKGETPSTSSSRMSGCRGNWMAWA